MSRSQSAAQHTADTAGAQVRHAEHSARHPDRGQPAALSNRAIGRALGPGTPLAPDVRAEMEQRFGSGFGDVRVHDDDAGHLSAAALGAKAYTHGPDVVFGAGRYTPRERDGRRLLAHELAHVVQQRRGGAAPQPGPSAAHEVAAGQAAAQVAAGATGVTVQGATGIGIACEVDEDQKRTKLPQSHAEESLPAADAARVLQPGAGYWLTHSPDAGAMPPLALRDEAEQIREKLFIQTQSSAQTVRLEQVLAMLEGAAARLPQGGAQPAAKRRKGAGRAKGPGAGSAADAAASGSRSPLTTRNASSLDPARLTADYDDIVRDLGRTDLTPRERAALQLELDGIEPLVGQELGRRSALRYGNLIDDALTPEDRYYGDDKPLIEHMRRIDQINSARGQPGMNYLHHGRERIPVSDLTLKAIREHALRSLGEVSDDVRSANEETMADYAHVVDQTFENHPIVGAISMFRSEQNPLDWEEKLLPIVATSNIRAQMVEQMRAASRDPWNPAPPSLEEMARTLDAAERVGTGARTYLDYKTDQLHEGTRGAIRHLGRMKTAGQVAANIAFSPLGGALYSATESTLEQLSEMHYGQRDHFDYLAPVIDAASAYVGGKVTNGLLGGLGKNAPLWLRMAAFVPADRLGAAATTLTHGTIDRALERSDKGFSDIVGAAGADLIDWKQAGINLFTLGLGHAARSAPGKTKAPTTATQPTETDAIRSAESAEVAKAAAAPAPVTPAPDPANDNLPAPPAAVYGPELAKPAANANAAMPVARGPQRAGPHTALPAQFEQDAFARLEQDQPFGSGYSSSSRREMAQGREGKGQREAGVHIDESIHVGDQDASPARRVHRAMDPHNHQFLDAPTNSETKHEGTSARDIARNREPLTPVSLSDRDVPPSAILTRRFSEVVELKAVFKQATDKIRKPGKYTPGELKEKINANVWKIVSKGESPAGRAVLDAFHKLGFAYVPEKGMRAMRLPAAGMRPPQAMEVE